MERPCTPNNAVRSRLLVRGEAIIASTGLAVAAIFLLSIASAGAWTVYIQRSTDQIRARTDLESKTRILARTVEAMLETGEVSESRSQMTTFASDAGLAACSVVLPDGRVIVDALSNQDVLKELPESWDGSAGQSFGVAEHGRRVELAMPLSIAGRGQANLKVARKVDYSWLSGWEAQTGIGVIGALGFIAVWAVYRRLRFRLRALGAIREALLAAEQGEHAAAALSVSHGFGAEAAAWNRILEDRERLRNELAAERARGALAPRSEGRADLVQACDALWHGLMLVDESLQITYLNGAAAVLLCGKRESMAGSDVTGYIKDEPTLAQLRAVVSGSVRRKATVEIKRPEPEGGGVLRFSIRPVRRDDKAAVLVVIEDVTQQRVADAARNGFVAQATHELRTPLTNIRLYVEQAIESGEDKAVRVKALDVINQESRRLERIVGDMLSVSEIEAGSFKLRTDDVRLETLFDDLRDEYIPQARERGIELSFALPPKLPVLTGDRDKIVLALHNLLGNAIKYTPTGGRVDVKVEADEEKLKVDVADTGIGINPEESELIFEKFYRARDQRVSTITGTGLGLALARDVVRMHGGDISVRSQLDKGSTFTLTLPARAEAA